MLLGAVLVVDSDSSRKEGEILILETDVPEDRQANFLL